MDDAPKELPPAEAARLMRDLDPFTRERLIEAGGDKVLDLRPALRARQDAP